MKRTIVLAVLSLIAVVSAAPAQATVITYFASLSGANESPVVNSPGSGSVTVTVDTVANTMLVVSSFTGLLGTTTASHIHCCAPLGQNAGVATTTPTFAGFPLGVTSGNYTSALLDLTAASSYNPAFVMANGGLVANAEAALLAGLAANMTYFNIHTTAFPGGEIRGFLAPRAVPEPAAPALLAIGLLGAVLAGRRRSVVRHRANAVAAD